MKVYAVQNTTVVAAGRLLLIPKAKTLTWAMLSEHMRAEWFRGETLDW